MTSEYPFYAENHLATYYNHGLYDEWNISYDKIGNINTLNRQGAYGQCEEDGMFHYRYGEIDRLGYIYNTDRTHLNAVLDFATGDAAPKGVPAAANPAYAYDPNGNLILDQAKNMKIKYNHLNLPRQVEAQGYNDYGSGTPAGAGPYVAGAGLRPVPLLLALGPLAQGCCPAGAGLRPPLARGLLNEKNTRSSRCRRVVFQGEDLGPAQYRYPPERAERNHPTQSSERKIV